MLYQVVQQHMQTLFAEAEARSEHGGGYPAHVKREFARYLSCGQLAGGFTRLACRSCGHQRLVPFSCKGRSVCPSCVARRMADTALHPQVELLLEQVVQSLGELRLGLSTKFCCVHHKITRFTKVV